MIVVEVVQDAVLALLCSSWRKRRQKHSLAADTVAVLSAVAITGATSRPLRADRQHILYALGSSWRRSKYQAASRSAMLAITALDQSPGPRTGGSQSLSQPLPNFLVGSRRNSAVIQQPNFPVIPRMIGPLTSSLSASTGRLRRRRKLGRGGSQKMVRRDPVKSAMRVKRA